MLTVEGGQYLRDGQPHQVISGAIHYFRIDPSLWRDRLLRLRALGLNTVETYVAWNLHERTRGQFDFTGPRDLAAFVTLAGELGLDVIVRPGPYICAEWDFGGLPAHLLTEPMDLRTSDPRYLAHVDRWLDAIVPVIAPLQATHGGPVVAVQVENEYGSFGSDKAYLEHVRAGLVARGIDVLLFTTDGELAHKLMHPSTSIVREYAVRVMGEVTDEMLRNLTRGVELEDGMANFTAITDGGGEGSNHWYHVSLSEGRNREVRRLWESQGLKVSRLKRVRYGNVLIPSHVKAGKYVVLPDADARALYQLAGMRWQPARKPMELRGKYVARKRGDKKIHLPEVRRKSEVRKGVRQDKTAQTQKSRRSR